MIGDVLAGMESRAGLVVRLRYHDWKVAEIAELLGVMESRVSQLYAQGLAELRELLGCSAADLLAR
ncbi:MAG: hypothetical protein LC798_21280 [Chloroflexi bacterium]|nr:hypothetical protein [Chloroflexota bacterium]